MTDEQKAKRIHDILYSTDDRAELAERIVELEDKYERLIVRERLIAEIRTIHSSSNEESHNDSRRNNERHQEHD